MVPINTVTFSRVFFVDGDVLCECPYVTARERMQNNELDMNNRLGFASKLNLLGLIVVMIKNDNDNDIGTLESRL